MGHKKTPESDYLYLLNLRGTPPINLYVECGSNFGQVLFIISNYGNQSSDKRVDELSNSKTPVNTDEIIKETILQFREFET